MGSTRARAFVSVAGLALSASIGCGSTLPSPPRTIAARAAFVEVPYPPPTVHAERVPPRPRVDAIWIDGSWQWTGSRWRWKDGGWFEAPARGVTYTDWALIWPHGTQLLYAEAAWRDASGTVVPEPRSLASAAGAPQTRARVSSDASDGGDADDAEDAGADATMTEGARDL